MKILQEKQVHSIILTYLHVLCKTWCNYKQMKWLQKIVIFDFSYILDFNYDMELFWMQVLQ
jgi:hypothetical protein